MSRRSTYSNQRRLGVAAALWFGVALAGCSDSDAALPVHLTDFAATSRSCLPILPDTVDDDALLFGGVSVVWHDQPLPEDLVYVDVIAESRLGYEVTPVLVTSSEGIPPDVAVLDDENWAEKLTAEPLPNAPRTDSYAVGVTVEVPFDGEQNPDEVAILVTGIVFTLDGVEHTQAVDQAVWISRMNVTEPDFCPQFSDQTNAIDDELGLS